MKASRSMILGLVLTALLATACGNQAAEATATITVTPTPDPCAPENIAPEVNKVHALMREFDDASLLAANTQLNQLSPAIASLQSIRRRAEDQRVPACLVQLKRLQLTHMDTVIATLVAFLSGTDQETLNQGIALSRQQHDAYTLELARLLGITLVAPPTGTAGAQAPSISQTATPLSFTLVNPGPSPLNMHVSASLTSAKVGLLEVGQSAMALGKSENGEWILIQLPGPPVQNGWVYSTLVQFSSGNLLSLPVVTSTPQQ
ncbi:MAG TPA: hypothetical protein VGJ22_00300 [Anaerolineales bacterium]|jgi:hypothetical protein